MSILDPPQAPGFDRTARGYALTRRLLDIPDLRLSIGEGDVGDPDEFKPSFVLRRWGGESAFGLQYIDTGLTGRVVDIVESDKIRWRDSTGLEIRFFDKPLHRDQISGRDGAFEFDFLIPALPPAGPSQNKFSFKVRRRNCRMEYQNPLDLGTFDPVTNLSTSVAVPGVRGVSTAAWDNRAHYEMVAGSYAIYHDSKMNNQYGCGKITHLLNPIAIDANGDRRLCSFNSDAQATGILTVTIPGPWFRNAAFPVRIDPTVGYTTTGASAVPGGTFYVNVWRAGASTPGDGTITKATIRCYVVVNSGTNEVGLGIYSNTGTLSTSALLSQATTLAITNTSAADNDLTMSGTLVAGTSYMIAVNRNNASSNNVRIMGDTTAWADNVDKTEGSMTMPANLTGYSDINNYKHTAYVTYTTGGSRRRIIVT